MRCNVFRYDCACLCISQKRKVPQSGHLFADCFGGTNLPVTHRCKTTTSKSWDPREGGDIFFWAFRFKILPSSALLSSCSLRSFTLTYSSFQSPILTLLNLMWLKPPNAHPTWFPDVQVSVQHVPTLQRALPEVLLAHGAQVLPRQLLEHLTHLGQPVDVLRPQQPLLHVYTAPVQRIFTHKHIQRLAEVILPQS